jgi:prepilin-type N-terminal cleavage/methylation domain-containing protein
VKRHLQQRPGFTLLETLLALMVFSVAVVALVEAVHQLGQHTLLRRHEAAVQERMRSLLVEQAHQQDPNPPEKLQVKDGNVTYTVQRTPLELFDRDGQTVAGLFEIRVTADWLEGRTPQQATAETWVYPPLYLQ